MSKKRILLKLTGTIFRHEQTDRLTRAFADSLAAQVKELQDEYQFGVVVGGGDFFRGAEHNNQLNLRSSIAHTVGMFGTVMNGLMLYDILCQHGVDAELFCALDCPVAGTPVSQPAIDRALVAGKTLVFSGGIATPYVTTDTNAVVRALQMQACCVWKASDVDGVFSCDPRKNKDAQKLPLITHQDIIDRQLTFIDHAAIIIAKQERLPIRVFDIFGEQALVRAASDETFGSLIQSRPI